ncbi:Spy/CpxP family protein refolding chaperone [candidate division KSB1 bacterium]|nr:Spy/CpxP family protein refolding chaperone [candidate division KSB1 bacterium]
MYFKPIIIAICLIVVGVMLFSGCSRHCRPFHGRMSSERKTKWVVRKISRELKLNDEQKQNLETMIRDIHSKMEVLHMEKGTMLTVLTDEVQKDSIDADVLNNFFTDRETDFKEIRSYAIDKLVEFHKTLTPEQRQKLAEKMQEIHKQQRG